MEASRGAGLGPWAASDPREKALVEHSTSTRLSAVHAAHGEEGSASAAAGPLAAADRAVATADRVVRLSHEHSKHCCKANCTLNICDKPPQVIGAKCFIFCVEKLCSGEGVSGVGAAGADARDASELCEARLIA